ncbi:MAG: LUD domain-containing protein [Candidatus Zambryskibacteria bacterium]|nr:LUD domain-containing protein [Candidatus Zambryskibacteria bacterium]
MYDTPKGEEQINRTISALKNNGIEALLIKDRAEAKNKVLEMIPRGANVMTMTSVTLDILGITEALNTSDYDSVREKFKKMDSKTQSGQMRALASAPDYTVGSVHAVTEDGKVLIASASGSQLPAYAYGAGKVIWVVGTQKIVKDFEDGMKRIYKYTLPLESERAHKAYGVSGSAVNKMLIINKEATPGRMTIIFVPENVGF